MNWRCKQHGNSLQGIHSRPSMPTNTECRLATQATLKDPVERMLGVSSDDSLKQTDTENKEGYPNQWEISECQWNIWCALWHLSIQLLLSKLIQRNFPGSLLYRPKNSFQNTIYACKNHKLAYQLSLVNLLGQWQMLNPLSTSKQRTMQLSMQTSIYL